MTTQRLYARPLANCTHWENKSWLVLLFSSTFYSSNANTSVDSFTTSTIFAPLCVATDSIETGFHAVGFATTTCRSLAASVRSSMVHHRTVRDTTSKFIPVESTGLSVVGQTMRMIIRQASKASRTFWQTSRCVHSVLSDKDRILILHSPSLDMWPCLFCFSFYWIWLLL